MADLKLAAPDPADTGTAAQAAPDSAMARFKNRLEGLANERKKREIAETILEFQSDAIEIEKGPPPRVALATTYLLLALFAVGVLWASLAQVDRVVTAKGQLATKSPQIVLQPFETAVIREIRVRPGDIVKAGDVLAVLDSTFVGADLAQLETQRKSYAEEIARLNAELAQVPYQPQNPGGPDAILQTAIAQQRKAAHEAKLADLDAQMAQAKASLAALKDDARVLDERVKVVSQIEDMRIELKKQDAGSKLQILVAQNSRLEAARDLEQVRNKQTEVGHQLRALAAQRETFVHQQRQQAASELMEATRKHDSVLDQMAKARRRQELVSLTAPEDAVVLSVAQRTVGSVQQAAEALLTLVPLNSELEAEVRISPADVGRLEKGLPTKVKLDAFPFQKHGMLKGELRVLSENTFQPEGRNPADTQSYYRGFVRLTDMTLKNVAADHRLLPGMTLMAEIKLGERSVMSYFLYPLIRTFDESLREP